MEYNLGVYEVSFYRQFNNTDGMVRRVLVVWVMPFLEYFNCCPFFVNVLNYRFPSGDHIMFMSRKGDILDVLILNLYFLSEVYRFVSFVHIYDVNCRCYFYTTLPDIC